MKPCGPPQAATCTLATLQEQLGLACLTGCNKKPVSIGLSEHQLVADWPLHSKSDVLPKMILGGQRHYQIIMMIECCLQFYKEQKKYSSIMRLCCK